MKRALDARVGQQLDSSSGMVRKHERATIVKSYVGCSCSVRGCTRRLEGADVWELRVGQLDLVGVDIVVDLPEIAFVVLVVTVMAGELRSGFAVILRVWLIF